MKRRYSITDEQKAYRERILNKKPRRGTVHQDPKKLTAFDYARNCIFWINEYLEGRESKNQFDLAVKSLKTLSEHLPHWNTKEQ